MAKEWHWAALHEAAHIVAGIASGQRPRLVQLMGNATSVRGFALSAPSPMPVHLRVVIDFAGMAAEWKAGNAAPWPGSRSDVASVRERLTPIMGESHAPGAAQSAWWAAVAFIEDARVWGAINELTSHLLLHGELNEDAIALILSPQRWPLPPLPLPDWAELAMKLPARSPDPLPPVRLRPVQPSAAGGLPLLSVIGLVFFALMVAISFGTKMQSERDKMRRQVEWTQKQLAERQERLAKDPAWIAEQQRILPDWPRSWSKP